MDRTYAFLTMLKYPGIPEQEELLDEFMQGSFKKESIDAT